MCTSEWIAILISAFALGFSIFALRQSSQSRKYDFYLALLKQYGSPEMLDALLCLWNFIDKCGKDTNRISEEFGKRYGKPNDPLDSHRRFVKIHYEHLAFLYFHNLIPRKFKPTLPTMDLRIIEFLKPMEEALGEKLRERDVTKSEAKLLPKESEKSRQMYRLYNEWLRFHNKSKD